MRQGVLRLSIAAAGVFLAACAWGTAASAKDRCVSARQMVQQHCGGTTKAFPKKEASWRCAKARAWLKDHCRDTAQVITPPKPVRAKGRPKVEQVAAKPSRKKRTRADHVRVIHLEPAVQTPNAKWQGWKASCCGPVFYHNGRRYTGGSPYGPAAPYNNFEGGFHPTVFYELTERNGLASQ